MLKISLLLALIPANLDVVKTFFSLTYYYATSRFFIYVLYKDGSLGLSTIMRTCGWLISKFVSKFCLGGLGSCAPTLIMKKNTGK